MPAGHGWTLKKLKQWTRLIFGLNVRRNSLTAV